jgi:SAM-dependent methyltransferase
MIQVRRPEKKKRRKIRNPSRSLNQSLWKASRTSMYPEAPLPSYGDLAYWEQRYAEDSKVFEWYQDSEAMLPAIKNYFEGEGLHVLVIGTGNSDCAPQIAQHGLENVVGIDFVKPAIVKSRKRNREVENVTWKVMDVRKLEFPENGFQVVFDKGTFGCLFFVGEADANLALAEIVRVLRRGGKYIYTSYALPDNRKPFLDRSADVHLELERIIKLPKPLPCEEKH